jgi:radical SAM superfamily enzyme YgiQ (UPF0313 family)
VGGSVKILLVYPQNPDTFWNFKYALKFVSKKAASPPLGLLTVASMLPKIWEKKLIDMTVTKLTDKDIKWADYIFMSAMSIQVESVKSVIARCKNLGAKIVAGGPLFTSCHADFDTVDHLILGEAENILPAFIADLENGCAKRIYSADEWANITKTPIPSWELIDKKKYSSLCIQYTRGCPFSCEFCDVTKLFGHKLRSKTPHQIIAELDSIYESGWRGGVFFVDDNFIGNKVVLKSDILPAITTWMLEKKRPFVFNTQASINLADDENLIRMMVRAGFDTVFIGIETPNEASLAECSKNQNKNRDMVACVRKIQSLGLQVQGGFILGFDNDLPNIFDRMTDFIQQSGIVTAMVGLLKAPKGTMLHKRMEKEDRLLTNFSGNNCDTAMDFVPKMDYDTLIDGYNNVIKSVYSPKNYYARIKSLLRNYRNPIKKKARIRICDLKALVKSFWIIGVVDKGRTHYWRLMMWSLFRRPKSLPLAVTLSIYGHHFRKVYAV